MIYTVFLLWFQPIQAADLSRGVRDDAVETFGMSGKKEEEAYASLLEVEQVLVPQLEESQEAVMELKNTTMELKDSLDFINR